MNLDDQQDRPSGADEEFVQLLIAEQHRLQHYILTLLPKRDAADNVLQETNIALWRKASDFTPGTNFSAWSRKVAYWKVQSYLRDRQREKVVFSSAMVSQLASRENAFEKKADEKSALRHCLSKVSGANLRLLYERYTEGCSIQAISSKVGKKESAIKVQLMRLRRKLLDCIERKVAQKSPGN